jgi:hypothetical protein
MLHEIKIGLYEILIVLFINRLHHKTFRLFKHFKIWVIGVNLPFYFTNPFTNSLHNNLN